MQVAGPEPGGPVVPGFESQGAAFEEATRAGDSCLCLRACVDHPGRLARSHGPVVAAAVVPALARLAREIVHPRRVLVEALPDELCVLVFAEPSSGEGYARALIDGARDLRLEGRSAPLRVSVSVGFAHNRRQGPPAWNTVLAVAEEGLEVARSAGGGRHVHTELYELYQPGCAPEKGVSLTPDRVRNHAARKLGARQAGSNGSSGAHERSERGPTAPPPRVARTSEKPPAPRPAEPAGGPSAGDGPGAAARGSPVRDLPGAPRGVSNASPRASELKNVEALRAELEELYETKYQQIFDQKMSGHSQQVDVLQRRIAKLTRLLGTTEEELRRVARLKTVDGGIPSLYRGVQGLSEEDDRFDLKRDLMTTIFEANLRLRGRELQQS